MAIQIEIGADISRAVQALKSFESELNRAGGVTQGTAEKIFQSLNKVLDSTEKLSGGGITDFTDRFEQARLKVHTSIDQMVNDALSIKPAFEEIVPQIPVQPALQSLDQLEKKLAELKAQIGASNDLSQIAKLSVEFAKVEKDAERLRNVFKNFSTLKVDAKISFPTGVAGQVQAFGGGVAKYENSLKRLAQTQAQTAKSTQGGTRAFQDFGRVLQDVAFGPAAIANNLEPLALSLREVSREAKATGQSVGSILLKSLTGGGGLLLGLSAVTAALSIASVGLDFWTRGFSNTSKETEKAKKELEDFKETLKSLTRSTSDLKVEFAASPEGDIAKVRALAAAVLDTNKSYKERNRAVQELRETNKAWFGDLSLEASKLATLKSKVDEYTQALIAQAVVKGFQDEISKVAVELSKQGNLFKKAATEADKYKTAVASAANQQKGLTIGFSAGSNIPADPRKVQETKEATKVLNEQGKVVNTLVNQFEDLQGALSDAVGQSLKFKPLTTDTGGGGKSKSQKFEFLFDFLPFDPTGKLKPEQKAQVLSAADKFSKEFGTILEGTQFRLNATSENQVILNANKFWEDVKKGLVKLKPGAFDIDFETAVKITPSVVEVDAEALAKKFISDVQKVLDQQAQIEGPQINFDDSANRIELIEKYRKLFDSIGASLPKQITVETDVLLPDGSVKKVKTLVDVNLDTIKALNKEVQKTFDSLDKKVRGSAEAITGILAPAFSGMFDAIVAGEDPLMAFFDSIQKGIQQLIKKLIQAALTAAVLSALTGGKQSFGAIFTKALGFNKGGKVPGHGHRDTVPAMLTPGEIIIPQKTAKSLPPHLVTELLSGRQFDMSKVEGSSTVNNIETNNPQSRSTISIGGKNSLVEGGSINNILSNKTNKLDSVSKALTNNTILNIYDNSVVNNNHTHNEKTEILKKLLASNILNTVHPPNTFGKLFGFSKGGLVPGSGDKDTVPALLAPGELVIPKNRVAEVTKLLTQSVSFKLPTSQFSSSVPTLSNVSFDIPTVTTSLSSEKQARLNHAGGLITTPKQKMDINVDGQIAGDVIKLVGKRTDKKQGRTV